MIKFTGIHLCQSLFFNKVAGLIFLMDKLIFVFFFLLCKSMDWFLYDRDFGHERVSWSDSIGKR